MRHLRPPLDKSEYRRFRVGDTFEISGIKFRIVKGRKKPGDLVVEWLTPDGWQSIKMSAAFLLDDFFYENEHWLYPPPSQGGDYYYRHVRHAMQFGWDKSAKALEIDKATKNAAPLLFGDDEVAS
jgi:hypothetical protein